MQRLKTFSRTLRFETNIKPIDKHLHDLSKTTYCNQVLRLIHISHHSSCWLQRLSNTMSQDHSLTVFIQLFVSCQRTYCSRFLLHVKANRWYFSNQFNNWFRLRHYRYCFNNCWYWVTSLWSSKVLMRFRTWWIAYYTSNWITF